MNKKHSILSSFSVVSASMIIWFGVHGKVSAETYDHCVPGPQSCNTSCATGYSGVCCGWPRADFDWYPTANQYCNDGGWHLCRCSTSSLPAPRPQPQPKPKPKPKPKPQDPSKKTPPKDVTGMIISNKDNDLAFHADGGAKHGSPIKLHSNCNSGNADCTWNWRKGMIVSRKNPSLAIHAYHGAEHGAQLRLHNNCKSANPDCTWFWKKGMIVNGGNPSLAFHAYHGAKHGAEIRLHKKCQPHNLDCSWSYKN